MWNNLSAKDKRKQLALTYPYYAQDFFQGFTEEVLDHPKISKELLERALFLPCLFIESMLCCHIIIFYSCLLLYVFSFLQVNLFLISKLIFSIHCYTDYIWRRGVCLKELLRNCMSLSFQLLYYLSF